MNTYNFVIPVSGYIKCGIVADNPTTAGEQLIEHKKEIIPNIPGLFLEFDFDNLADCWINDNENVNENKV